MVQGRVASRRGRWSTLLGVVGLVAAFAVAMSDPAEARPRKKKAVQAYAPPYAAMVVDAKTGRVLHAENEDALRHPASVTKVMTLYLLFEQIERGRLKLDTPLRVSARAAAQAPSKIGVRAGQTIEVEDAIKALVTKSANDVAVVVAEAIGGTEEEFAEMMTRRARSIGMTRSVFRNASGLPNPQQVTTARDLTILGRSLQDRFPNYYSYFGTRTFSWGRANYANHNRLLGRVEGVDGIKTGYTRASGFNLLTSARTENRHIVAAVLGGRSGAQRDRIMANLVESNLPRAFAGARTAAPILADATPERPRPAVIAAAPSATRTTTNPDTATRTQTTASIAPSNPAATMPPQVEPERTIRPPLELAAARPVAASTLTTGSTTPATLRWTAGPTGAPAPAEAARQEAPRQEVARQEAARQEVARAETAIVRQPAATAARPATAPQVTGWIIQVGATDDETKARDILADARSKSRGTLGKASPFTEKVVRDGTTLFRARFAGFDEADDAQAACKVLKRSGMACFAARL